MSLLQCWIVLLKTYIFQSPWKNNDSSIDLHLIILIVLSLVSKQTYLTLLFVFGLFLVTSVGCAVRVPERCRLSSHHHAVFVIINMFPSLLHDYSLMSIHINIHYWYAWSANSTFIKFLLQATRGTVENRH